VFLQLLPFVFILLQDPSTLPRWASFEGLDNDGGGFNLIMFGAGSTVLFSLVAQIGEQVDFLRFMPEAKKGKQIRWWLALLCGGPGWTVIGALKVLAGSFLAVLAFYHGLPLEQAQEPMHMYLVAFSHITTNPTMLLALAGIFVILSQLKINVTNAYAGSIAWSNFFFPSHPQPSRTSGVAGVQCSDRAGADGNRYLPGVRIHSWQLCHGRCGLDGCTGGGSGGQQTTGP
jgi:purine-cytosine permease-like protein